MQWCYSTYVAADFGCFRACLSNSSSILWHALRRYVTGAACAKIAYLHVQDVARHPDPAYCCHLYGHYWKILILYAMNCKAMRTWLYNVIFIHIVINTSPLSRLPKIEYFLPTVLSLEIGDKKRVFWPSLACQYSAYFGLRLRSAVSSWFCGVATHLLIGTLVERWREIPAMEILADQVCLFCDLIVNKVNLIIPDQGKLRKEARKAASSHRISSRVVEWQ